MSGGAPKKRRRKSQGQSGGPPSASKSLLLGLVWAVGAAVALIFIFSAIVYATPDPGSLVLPAALAAAYLSAFVGGFAAAWINRGDALACGLIVGVANFILIVLLSLIAPGGAASEIGFWASTGLHALVIGFSVLGAFAGASIRESSNRRQRKFRR
ncbi:MAG: TIGR04086 family membrane protein [Eubacteriales bacterium]|jgi:putative membrane protein (TIGR04086 family)